MYMYIYISISVYIYAAVQQKTEAQAIFLNPLTICSLCKCKLVVLSVCV